MVKESFKFILLPVQRIIDNVIGNPAKGGIITDDVIMKTRLPFKFVTQPVCMAGYSDLYEPMMDETVLRPWF